MRKRKINYLLIYDVIITILVFISVILVFLDLFSVISMQLEPYNKINFIIMVVFWFDYINRFNNSENKRIFVRQNLVDLIAILPFNQLFSLFRITRIFRIARFTKLTKLTKAIRLLKAFSFIIILKNKLTKFLHTNGFIYVLYCLVILIISSSVVMIFAEEQSFADALWWSIVTVTTVGYGDISPSSSIGRIVAVILMVFGIGFIGMLTGTITTYFTKNLNEDNETVELNNLVKRLSKEQKTDVIEYIKKIK